MKKQTMWIIAAVVVAYYFYNYQQTNGYLPFGL
jgi:hypothetical protein